MKAFLLDDEPLAVSRLKRMLEESGRVEIAGATTDPTAALRLLRESPPEVLFLDIEMPGMSGFELLEQLGERQPLVVFTTAYDRYALDAFQVNSIDYLLKPIEPRELERALAKLERTLGGGGVRSDVGALLAHMRTILAQREPQYLTRIASRMAGRVDFIDVSDVSWFYAKDKLTFAATMEKHYPLDLTIAQLEQKLPPQNWLRIHRATLLNVSAIKELHAWFGGKVAVKLKDGKTTLHVARERVAEVKLKLGL
ncbi:MAG: response regulator transcription factor [Bryobacterales bacterium]|nr:response regulator transcription factor [Bryobacterales bacterium]MBV9397942.1 response regulator transcription factor [Bryobacterales bacterium]